MNELRLLPATSRTCGAASRALNWSTQYTRLYLDHFIAIRTCGAASRAPAAAPKNAAAAAPRAMTMNKGNFSLASPAAAPAAARAAAAAAARLGGSNGRKAGAARISGA